MPSLDLWQIRPGAGLLRRVQDRPHRYSLEVTYGYFNGNVVTEYTYEQSVIDNVNVDFQVYRIKTEVTSQAR